MTLFQRDSLLPYEVIDPRLYEVEIVTIFNML